VVVVLSLLVAWLGGRALLAYTGIERVDLSDVLDPVTGAEVNYLLVGSDSREDFDPDVEPGTATTVEGRRSDTIILLRTGPGGSRMMSIPRDLWVTYPVSQVEGRINGAYAVGPAALVRTVQSALDVPVHHYVEIGFASFGGVVDAIGGVTIEFPHPASDVKSGLNVPQAGPVTLDGDQALAYVRSRTYTEVIFGQAVVDPTADLGRQQRQQAFLRAALAQVGAERNPFELVDALSALSGGLVLDDSASAWDLFALARSLSSAPPETVVLPTRPTVIDGADVLVLVEPQADEVLATFR
jgi:LCP family protein required for cell wall assembly